METLTFESLWFDLLTFFTASWT